MSSAAYKPKFGYDIRIHPELSKRAETAVRACAITGCRDAAELKVPKDRRNLEDRHWLCREHLREHNQRWNFFAGMSDEEIASYCLDALTGHRPTWPLGKRSAGVRGERSRETPRSGYWNYQFEDGFSIFEEAAEPSLPPKPSRLTKGQLDALAILNLEETATLQEIKARYKELVKRFHPDTNGGDRGSEERLKQVIRAYGHLRATGLTSR